LVIPKATIDRMAVLKRYQIQSRQTLNNGSFHSDHSAHEGIYNDQKKCKLFQFSLGQVLRYLFPIILLFFKIQK
jgi:hypothetical protein